MATLRPRVSMFFCVAILVCFILMEQVHAHDASGHNIHTFHDLANEDADDARYGHIIGNLRRFEDDDDPNDDRPDVTVLGH
ncbi:hypothetical protein C2S53_009609 [Perilla frutescens var. hirtella]|uniref:Uncharacterized protein n=1 Tax=Perilla frutescens var. hirtella TaxID=608512 RepID=A0AAD4JQ46_PERFH|nr:hypothetical protein C2S53_009609 [Perilla frutescens var. hirtella]